MTSLHGQLAIWIWDSPALVHQCNPYNHLALQMFSIVFKMVSELAHWVFLKRKLSNGGKKIYAQVHWGKRRDLYGNCWSLFNILEFINLLVIGTLIVGGVFFLAVISKLLPFFSCSTSCLISPPKWNFELLRNTYLTDNLKCKAELVHSLSFC